MTILLFVLTAVLVGYVVYTFYSSDAGQVPGQAPLEKPESVEPQAPPQEPEPAESETATAEPAEESPAAPEPPAAPEQPHDASEAHPTHYRNPKTGDTAAVPSNYRFAKRWIKEALVTEGLLDKIYKNNELDKNTSKKVKAALAKFKEIEKYHA